MNDHAKFSPSSASRWMYCPASTDYKDETVEDYAQFGTDIHSYIAGGPANDAWTAEQQADADRCKKEWQRHVPDFAEAEVKLFSKDFPDLLFGTIDALWITGDTCHIADMKTGFRGVNVVGNQQLLCYALLALDNYPLCKFFEVSIVQPRRYYYGVVRYSREEIEGFRERIASVFKNPQVFVAGSHCKYCPALYTCDTARAKVYDLIYAHTRLMNQGDKVDPQALLANYEELLKCGSTIAKLLERAENELLKAAIDGTYKLTSHKLVAGRKLREWAVDNDVLEFQFGDGIYTDKALLTPYAAEQRFGKSEALTACTRTIEGPVQLAPIDSIKESISTTADEFNTN